MSTSYIFPRTSGWNRTLDNRVDLSICSDRDEDKGRAEGVPDERKSVVLCEKKFVSFPIASGGGGSSILDRLMLGVVPRSKGRGDQLIINTKQRIQRK